MTGFRRGADAPVQRPRLLDQLQRAQAQRCVVLTAPAGSGKSTLLQGWAARLRGRARVCWVSGTALDTGGLAATLVARCAAVDDALARALPAQRPADETELLSLLSVALVRTAPLAQPLVLILDDLHALPDGSALQALQPLLDYGPDRLQCVFASRAALPLSLSRLRTYGQLLEVGAADLRWTLEESEVLVRARLGRAGLPHAPQWHAATAGWSLGLESICRAVQEGADPSAEPIALLREAFGFLQREVLAHWPPAEHQLMTTLAALEPFDVSLAAAVSAIEPARCADTLQRVRADSGFLASFQRPDGGTLWRFHPVLGALLRHRFSAGGDVARHAAHRAASAFFAARGLRPEAVRHALLAGDRGPAADLVEAWASPLFQAGDLRQLAELVQLVPPAVAARRRGLRLWLALVALLQRRFEDCEDALDALERDGDALEDAIRRRVAMLRGWLAVYRDDIDAATSALGEAVRESAPAANNDGITLAGERNVRTWVHVCRNEYQQARDVQQAPPAGEAPQGTLFGILSGRCLFGLSLALEGRMAEAERIYRDVLHEADAGGERTVDAAVLAVGLLGEVLYEVNDLKGVLGLQSRLADLERTALPDPLLRANLAICRSHAVQGRTDAALASCRRLQELGRGRRLDRLLAYALMEEIRLHLLREDPQQAHAPWNELGRLRASLPRAGTSIYEEVAMVEERVAILLMVHRGRLEEAGVRTDNLLADCIARGRHRRVAALHFQRAAIDRTLGNESASRDHAMRGLQAGALLGLLRSLLDACPEVPELLEDLLAQQALDPLLAFHADRIRAAVGRGPLAAAELGGLNGPRVPSTDACATLADLSEREREIARMLALALPNKQIARELGLSPETVKWHLHNIYAKLSVTTRYEAVRLLR